MVDKEETAKTPSPVNIKDAIEGEVLNQKTARSKYKEAGGVARVTFSDREA